MTTKTWHPPIPTGRLYSGPAIKLGPGLALLVWCYDHVERNATIEIKLEKAAADIGKPYGTIKDWWKLLREGPFFCEQIDRGRRGWVVRMSDDWLDWHVMKNNYPDEGGNVNHNGALNEPSPDDEGRDVSFEDVQGPVKAPSRPRQGRDVSFEHSRNKVLHEDQNPERVSVENTRESTAHETRTPAPKSEHPAVALYVSITGVTPPKFAAEMIAKQVTNLARWEESIKDWLASGFKPGNVKGMLDWYHGKGKHQQNGQSPQARPPPPLNPVKPVENPLPREQLAEMARNSRKHHDTS